MGFKTTQSMHVGQVGLPKSRGTTNPLKRQLSILQLLTFSYIYVCSKFPVGGE